jgi:hypothetical protein
MQLKIAKMYYVVQYISDFTNNIHTKFKLDVQYVNGEDRVHRGLVAICNQLTTNIGAK